MAAAAAVTAVRGLRRAGVPLSAGAARLWRARLSRNVREVRFMFCDRAEHSEGMREFLRASYDDLCVLNPGTPLLVRDFTGMDCATIIARYDWGTTAEADVTSLDADGVEAELRALVEGGAARMRSMESQPPEDDVIDGTRWVPHSPSGPRLHFPWPLDN